MAVVIPLTRGMVALVDDEDATELLRYAWFAVPKANGRIYAKRTKAIGEPEPKTIAMHRQIMGAPVGVQVDHVDRDGLNNTRANLRICTQSQNQANRKLQSSSSTGFKGVVKRRAGTFQAGICVNGRSVHLGTFKTAEAAHEAYMAAAHARHGEFARAA